MSDPLEILMRTAAAPPAPPAPLDPLAILEQTAAAPEPAPSADVDLEALERENGAHKADTGFFEGVGDALVQGTRDVRQRLLARRAASGERLAERLGGGDGRFDAEMAASVREEAGADRTKLAELEQTTRAYEGSPVAEAMMGAKTFGEALAIAKIDPLAVATEVGARSLPQMVEQVVLTFAGGLVGLGAKAAAVAGGAAGGAASAFGADVLNQVREAAGGDLTDVDAVERVMADQKVMDGIRATAAKYAAPIGAAGGLGAGLAGSRLGGAALASRLGGRTGAAAGVAATVGAQTAVQGTLGAGGEAAGQLAAGRELQPGEIVGEAIGAVAQTPVEALQQAQAARSEGGAPSPAPPETTPETTPEAPLEPEVAPTAPPAPSPLEQLDAIRRADADVARAARRMSELAARREAEPAAYEQLEQRAQAEAEVDAMLERLGAGEQQSLGLEDAGFLAEIESATALDFDALYADLESDLEVALEPLRDPYKRRAVREEFAPRRTELERLENEADDIARTLETDFDAARADLAAERRHAMARTTDPARRVAIGEAFDARATEIERQAVIARRERDRSAPGTGYRGAAIARREASEQLQADLELDFEAERGKLERRFAGRRKRATREATLERIAAEEAEALASLEARRADVERFNTERAEEAAEAAPGGTLYDDSSAQLPGMEVDTWQPGGGAFTRVSRDDSANEPLSNRPPAPMPEEIDDAYYGINSLPEPTEDRRASTEGAAERSTTRGGDFDEAHQDAEDVALSERSGQGPRRGRDADGRRDRQGQSERHVQQRTGREPQDVGRLPAGSLESKRHRAARREAEARIAKAKKGIRAFFKRNYTKEGDRPPEMFEAVLALSGASARGQKEVERMMAGFEREVAKAADVKRYKDLDTATREAMNAYLAGRRDVELSTEMKAALKPLRDMLDVHSGKIENAINDLVLLKIGELPEEQQAEVSRAYDAGEQEGIPAHIMGLSALQGVIRGRMGQYLHRSYQLFGDPEWATKVRNIPHIYNDAIARFRAEGLDAEQAEGAVNAILNKGAEAEGMLEFLSGSMVGSKPMTILMKRREIPLELRRLMGEVEDPKVNFLRSIEKMQRFVQNHEFLMRVRQDGESIFLFKEPEGAFAAPVAARGNKGMSPLDGWHTTPEIAETFTAFEENFAREGLVGALIRFNSVVKYNKTVMSVTTQARNVTGQGIIAVGNGHFDIRQMPNALRAIRADVTNDTEWASYIDELIERRVIHAGAFSEEVRLAIRDMLDVQEGKKGGVVRRGVDAYRALADIAQKGYRASDDLWRIYGYEIERQGLEKAGLAPEAAAAKAAERISLGYPTYDFLPLHLRSLRRAPLVGSFVSFAWEAMRSFVANGAIALEDAAAGRHAMASRRAAGMAFQAGGLAAMSTVSMMLFGIDDDEEDAHRRFQPEWDRNTMFIFTGRDKNGTPTGINLSYLDPLSAIKRPFSALANDNNESALATFKDTVGELLSPYLSPEIGAGALFELLANEKLDGGRVRNPADGAGSQFVDVARHLWDTVKPGTASNVERFAKALQDDVSKSGRAYREGDEALALLGFRALEMNIPQSLVYKAQSFGYERRDAEAILRDEAKTLQNRTGADIERAFERMVAARKKVFGKLIGDVEAAREMGLPEETIEQMLIVGGVRQGELDSIMQGEVPPWSMPRDYLGMQEARGQAGFDEDRQLDVEEMFADRRYLIEELAEEERYR